MCNWIRNNTKNIDPFSYTLGMDLGEFFTCRTNFLFIGSADIHNSLIFDKILLCEPALESFSFCQDIFNYFWKLSSSHENFKSSTSTVKLYQHASKFSLLVLTSK